ncbi:MAG: hypothetical protein LAO08_00390 [Acidobacteriia bacterium]|nr:hypothetical protein [Terriglobia bacterium]
MKRQDRMAARARVWLPAQLEEGPQLTRQLFESAEAAGISRHALCRIQQELGVQTARRGGKWWWYGEAHAHLFPLKKMKENSTTIREPLTELCIVDFTAPGGFRILKLPPMTHSPAHTH